MGSEPGRPQARGLHGGEDGRALPPCLSLSLSDSPTHLAQCKAHSRLFTGSLSNEHPCTTHAETYARMRSDCPSATQICESASSLPLAHSPKTKNKREGRKHSHALDCPPVVRVPPDSEPGSTRAPVLENLPASPQALEFSGTTRPSAVGCGVKKQVNESVSTIFSPGLT